QLFRSRSAVLQQQENENDAAEKLDDNAQGSIKAKQPLQHDLATDKANDGEQRRRWQCVAMLRRAEKLICKIGDQQTKKQHWPDKGGRDRNKHDDKRQHGGDKTLVVETKTDGRFPPKSKDIQSRSAPPGNTRSH